MPAPPFGRFLGELAQLTARQLGGARADLRTYGRLPAGENHVAGVAYVGAGHMLVGHHVPELVERMFDRRLGRDLDLARDALGTMVHEMIHLVIPDDFDQRRSNRTLGTPSGLFIEEGVTEAAAQRVLPAVLGRYERLAPGLSLQVPDRSGIYVNYVPAVRELLSVVGRLPESVGRDLLSEIARVGPDRKFDLLVEQAMDGFGLTSQVPREERTRVRARVRSTLEARVAENVGWMVPPDRRQPRNLNTREALGLSTIMGRRMGIELLRQLHLEAKRSGVVLPATWRSDVAQEEWTLARKLRRHAACKGPEARSMLGTWMDDMRVAYTGRRAAPERMDSSGPAQSVTAQASALPGRRPAEVYRRRGWRANSHNSWDRGIDR